MNRSNRIGVFAALLFSTALAQPSQAEVFTSTYSTMPCQDYELLTDMLVGPGVARHPSGGLISATQPYQVGVFSNLVAQVVPSFTNGVILSTGKISDGSSLVNKSSYDPDDWPEEALSYDRNGDADLDRYFGYTGVGYDGHWDTAGLVLYLHPTNKTINIPFIMASEEFFVGSDSYDYPDSDYYKTYSDKFAFFLKEIADVADYKSGQSIVDDVDSSMATNAAGTEWTNIATLPEGGNIEISSVNQHTNTQYFISNVVADGDGYLTFPAADINLPMEFNGAIVGPVAVVENLDTNKIYKLKIVIGDDSDNTLNSAVFLRSRGITSGADLKLEIDGPASLTSPGEATFTDVVTNIGPAPADGVTVRHSLPEGVDPSTVSVTSDVGSFGGIVQEGGTNYFVWTIGDRFMPGDRAEATINCTFAGVGSYTNFAAVATTTGDYDETNNTNALVTAVGGSLRIEAVSTNKVYGAEFSVSDNLQFVALIDGTNAAQHVTGVVVTFTNALGEVVDPATAPVGTYAIVLSDVQ